MGKNRSTDHLTDGSREVLKGEARTGVEQPVIEKAGKEAESGGKSAADLLRWKVQSEEEMDKLGCTEQPEVEPGTS